MLTRARTRRRSNLTRFALAAIGLAVVAPCNVQYPPSHTQTYWGVAIAQGHEVAGPTEADRAAGEAEVPVVKAVTAIGEVGGRPGVGSEPSPAIPAAGAAAGR